jgi:TRAP-type mannitol/chloroaromatic compound transport system substrate-binding protein
MRSTRSSSNEGLKINIKPFMMQPMGPDPFGWFKTPINSIADMKKLKVPLASGT